MADAQEKTVDGGENVYDGINDVVGILKKGIILNQPFLTGKYKNVLKEATLDSFNTALRDFAVIEAKLQTDSGFAQDLAKSGQDIADAGISLSDVSKLKPDAEGGLTKFISDTKLKSDGSRQMGGPVPDTGMYKLHKGEAVLDQSTYGSVQRSLRDGGGAGAGGGGTTVNLTINAAPNWTPQQFESSVQSVMDKVARRH